jgi:hypothetical protein
MMPETAPRRENHKAASLKPTKACSETQATPPTNHALKNSRKFFSAFQFLLPASHVLSSMPNPCQSETGLDVKASLLVGSTLIPVR